MTTGDPRNAALERVRAAKRALTDMLRGVPEVNGIGITRVGDDYALKVDCERSPSREMPTEVDGVEVVVEVVGKIQPRR